MEVNEIKDNEDAYKVLKPIFDEAKENNRDFRSILEYKYPNENQNFDRYVNDRFNGIYKYNPLKWTELIVRIEEFLANSRDLTSQTIEAAIQETLSFFGDKIGIVVPIYCNVNVSVQCLKISDEFILCSEDYLFDYAKKYSKKTEEQLKSYCCKYQLFAIVYLSGKKLSVESYVLAKVIVRYFCELFNVVINEKGKRILISLENNIIDTNISFFQESIYTIKNSKVYENKWYVNNELLPIENEESVNLDNLENIELLKSWYSILSPYYVSLEYKKENKYSLVIRAITWLSDSLKDCSEENSLLKLIISLEILLERETNLKKGKTISSQLAESLDLFLDLTNKEFNVAAQKLSSAYKSRSLIVHEGQKISIEVDYLYLFDLAKKVVSTVLTNSEFQTLSNTKEVYKKLEVRQIEKERVLIREILAALKVKESISFKEMKEIMSKNYQGYTEENWFWKETKVNNGYYVPNDWLINHVIRLLEKHSLLIISGNKYSLTPLGENLNIDSITFKDVEKDLVHELVKS